MLLGIMLDHRSWMRFLIEEWLAPNDAGQITLGVNSVIESPYAPELTKVAVWFDQNKLPALDMEYWERDGWQKSPPAARSGAAVSWHGPLPLFAVAHFTVESPEIRAHLLAMVRNFADIEIPPQPIKVGAAPAIPAPAASPALPSSVTPPAHWDSLRGAASMAIATVPTIGPWLQHLCDSLSCNEAVSAEEDVHAPWLHAALWDQQQATNTATTLPLWRAICAQLAAPRLLSNWRPEQILNDVCMRARELGESDEVLDRLSDSTMLLLRDRGTIETTGLLDNTVALVFQLILLRPTPARFLTWKEDWRAIPPGAWWTGAILSGYLSGYKGLPLSMRGSAASRLQIALRTWKRHSRESIAAWDTACSDKVDWKVNNGNVLISTSKELLAEHRLSARGQWYAADFTDSSVQAEATGLARSLCPHNLQQQITIAPGEYKTDGSAKIKLDSKKSCLIVSKPLVLPISDGIIIDEHLHTTAFRRWLADASMPFKLPRPSASGAAMAVLEQAASPANSPKENGSKPGQQRRTKKSEEQADAPQGLTIHENFIDERLESELIRTIDQLPWDATMARRVQHYGWQYDYKARRIDRSSYLGELPDWAAHLAERLLGAGLVADLPDQVIVNEYRGMQGISKHIDCPSCFTGPVVTISLCETWEMVFTKKTAMNTELKHRAMLPRRSATVLDGESRSIWSHEIAKKKTDQGYPRGRRVSITFRKVLIS